MARVFRDIDLGIFELRRHLVEPENGTKLTFASYATAWLERLPLSKSTRAGYRAATHDIWIPAFGDRHPAHISPAEIQNIMCDRLDEVSARTINSSLIPLCAIFHAAIEEGLLDRSPLATIRNLKVEHDLPDPFSRREMETILGHLRHHHPEHLWNWYEFAFTTGVRPSEQIALRWEDVDWDGGAIRVQRARVLGEVKSTKNSRVRDVMLSDLAREVLPRQQPHSFNRGQGASIFLNPVTKRTWPCIGTWTGKEWATMSFVLATIQLTGSGLCRMSERRVTPLLQFVQRLARGEHSLPPSFILHTADEATLNHSFDLTEKLVVGRDRLALQLDLFRNGVGLALGRLQRRRQPLALATEPSVRETDLRLRHYHAVAKRCKTVVGEAFTGHTPVIERDDRQALTALTDVRS